MGDSFRENFAKESDLNYRYRAREKVKTLNGHPSQIALVSNSRASAQAFHYVVSMLATSMSSGPLQYEVLRGNLLFYKFTRQNLPGVHFDVPNGKVFSDHLEFNSVLRALVYRTQPLSPPRYATNQNDAVKSTSK